VQIITGYSPAPVIGTSGEEGGGAIPRLLQASSDARATEPPSELSDQLVALLKLSGQVAAWMAAGRGFTVLRKDL